jgi:hypothetical protein
MGDREPEDFAVAVESSKRAAILSGSAATFTARDRKLLQIPQCSLVFIIIT